MHPLEGSEAAADIAHVRTRLRKLRSEAGFGLIELLMAITILNIGILAIVGAYNAGIISLRRASQVSTAAALGDQQMELYRRVTFDQIALDGSALAAVDSTYKCDPALGSGACPYPTVNEVTRACTTPIAQQCVPSRVVNASTTPASPDRHNYRVDTYIVWTCSIGTLGGNVTSPTCNPPSGMTTSATRPVKVVTIVVRDGNSLGTVLARQTSTFDCSTGQPYNGCPS